MRNRLVTAALVISLATAAWIFHRRIFQDDQKRIREIIETMRAAAEQKNAEEFMKYFSRDYKDSSGNNKFMIYRMVKINIQAVDEFEAEVSDLDVLVTGDSAWATLKVVTHAVRDGRIISPFGSERDPEMPRITFKRTSTGDWAITRVENVNR